MPNFFAKAAHERRLLETSDAFKRAHARWRDRLFQWNADTIAFYAIAGHMTQDAIGCLRKLHKNIKHKI
jgi:hypothetical protein